MVSASDPSVVRKVKLVFVQNKKSEILTLISTDTSLTEKQIVERFGSRWRLQSYLNLQKTTRYIDYREIHASTAIAMLQFQMLSYGRHLNSD